jgi:undecaprenyl-diphosphatase
MNSDRQSAEEPPQLRTASDPFLLKPLVIGFVAAALAFAFAKLGNEVGEGETRIFDLQILQFSQLMRLTNPWLADVMRDLSGLGSTTVLTLFTVATVGYLALVSARLTALMVATSTLTGTMLVSVFKVAFGRLRPDSAYAEFWVPSLSFPSGHASMSAIVFLTLGTLMASTRERRSERVYFLGAASLLTVLVGFSRIGLGVHWATDVLGGWAFGSAWALGWLLLARQVARRNDR